MNYQQRMQEARARAAAEHRECERIAGQTLGYLFDTEVEVDGHGCWNWLGKASKGYGYYMFRGKTIPAHRLAYFVFVGEIPEGLVLDHLCENKTCVNFEHLEPVTNAENIRRHFRAKAARKAAFS